MPDARTEPEETEGDPQEWVRLLIIAAGLAVNLAIIYWQYKDTAEMIELRAKVRAWWDRHVTGPATARRNLARMEAETVFEAIQTVEDAQ